MEESSPKADIRGEDKEIVAATSSAETKDQNGKVMRRRREYPPATELLQTQSKSTKKPPIRPFTTDKAAKPIEDEHCLDLAIALAKLDLTCLKSFDSAARYGSDYRFRRDSSEPSNRPAFTGAKYNFFRTKQKALDITDNDINLVVRALRDIDGDGSMIIGQEYLCGTELSRYWELLPSALGFLGAPDAIRITRGLPEESEEVRQRALVAARKGALKTEIRTALRQRWTSFEEVAAKIGVHMDPELRKVMLGLTV
ncbi:MAG: hypothetical protein OHK93_004912 [Ramalina farinacea]|uniref:Uncharacterized protein n=1 Tax=Ramalina farinacea TaxID=258253 RepID=A0AA43U0R9_9LECA|nr:hypothetical protein [Ramalina farinacea]